MAPDVNRKCSSAQINVKRINQNFFLDEFGDFDEAQGRIGFTRDITLVGQFARALTRAIFDSPRPLIYNQCFFFFSCWSNYALVGISGIDQAARSARYLYRAGSNIVWMSDRLRRIPPPCYTRPVVSVMSEYVSVRLAKRARGSHDLLPTKRNTTKDRAGGRGGDFSRLNSRGGGGSGDSRLLFSSTTMTVSFIAIYRYTRVRVYVYVYVCAKFFLMVTRGEPCTEYGCPGRPQYEPFVPAPPGHTPSCAPPGQTFCETLDHYPRYVRLDLFLPSRYLE